MLRQGDARRPRDVAAHHTERAPGTADVAWLGRSLLASTVMSRLDDQPSVLHSCAAAVRRRRPLVPGAVHRFRGRREGSRLAPSSAPEHDRGPTAIKRLAL